MKKIITIVLVFISLSGSAQFKSNAEANKYKTVQLVIDSAYNLSGKGKMEKAKGVYFKWILEAKDTVTGKIFPIEFTLYTNGTWKEQKLKK